MTRDMKHSGLLGLGAVALVGFLTACGGQPPQDSSATRTSTAALDTAIPMIVYSPRGAPVDQSGFVSLGDPSNLGGVVLSGNPQISARIDYARNGVMAGLFKATTGVVQVTFPFTEHATILEGEVIITDETGQVHKFKAGDSYLIHQGQVVLWDVEGKYVIKSFFNIVEQ